MSTILQIAKWKVEGLRCPDHEISFEENGAISPEGWKKLCAQLLMMEIEQPALSFLLVYVPARRLNDAKHRFGTWEQRYLTGKMATCSRFGISILPASPLIDAWKRGETRLVIPDPSNGLVPDALSLGSLLLKMLTCQIGHWSAGTKATESLARSKQPKHEYTADRELRINVTLPQDLNGNWDEFVEALKAATTDENL